MSHPAMTGIATTQIVLDKFLTKDNVDHAGLIQELLNSAIDFAKIELILEIAQKLNLFNIHQILLLNVMQMVLIIMDVMEDI